MKKTIISLMLLLIATCGWAQKVWKTTTSFCDNDILSLTAQDVEFKQDETILHLRQQNAPGSQIGFPKSTILKDQNGKIYAIKSGKPTRGYETECILDERTTVPENGILNLALHFEPVPETTERFHVYTGYNFYGFRIWNIQEPKTMEISLFNSNWRNEQGDWVLGLYDSGAVYGGKAYSYAEKSDKKIVLSNGSDKLTIAIGKEKAGKRQFTINGEKMTLECFGATIPAYPTEDNTAFNTDLKKGEVVISGWIKDFPKEIPEEGTKYGVSIKVMDLLTGELADYKDATIDEEGRFSIKVKVSGTQCITYHEVANDALVYETRMFVEPGKNYFVMHNWNTDKCLFMGDDARLQNEFQAFPCKFERKTSRFTDDIKKSFDSIMVKYNDYIAKYPTLSKRYRDYILQEAQLRAAHDLIQAPEIADQIIKINPTLPISLSQTLPDYLFTKLLLTASNVQQKYRPAPELYYSFEKQGKIKLSDSDRDLLKRWQQSKEEMKKLDNCKTREEYMAAYAEIEKICSDKEILAFEEREDIDKVYTEWAPKPYQTYDEVIDSLYSNQQMRDLNRASFLCHMITRDKTIPKDAAFLLDKIKDGNLKQQVTDLNNHYLELAKQNEEAVKKVIAPSSNVEGLTDGKAIVEKLIEPYKGKIVYMDIWGTWCQPCVQAIKTSPALKEAVKDYDIVYLYFSFGSEESTWKTYIGELGLTKPNYVHYNLPRKQQEAVVSYLGVDGYPFYVLFDKNGNMEPLDRGHISNIDGFKKKIEEISKK
jgi:thiol-disulfide isomerase/thioredoxin